MKRRKYLKAFGQLGDTASVPPGIADILEEVVCDLYGKSNVKSVNKAWCQLFNDKSSCPIKVEIRSSYYSL